MIEQNQSNSAEPETPSSYVELGVEIETKAEDLSKLEQLIQDAPGYEKLPPPITLLSQLLTETIFDGKTSLAMIEAYRRSQLSPVIKKKFPYGKGKEKQSLKFFKRILKKITIEVISKKLNVLLDDEAPFRLVSNTSWDKNKLLSFVEMTKPFERIAFLWNEAPEENIQPIIALMIIQAIKASQNESKQQA